MSQMPSWDVGPWRTDEDGGFPLDVHGPKNAMICRVVEGCEGWPESNAKLIAQSPTMADALVQWAAAESTGDDEELDNARRERDRIIEELLK